MGDEIPTFSTAIKNDYFLYLPTSYWNCNQFYSFILTLQNEATRCVLLCRWHVYRVQTTAQRSPSTQPYNVAAVSYRQTTNSGHYLLRYELISLTPAVKWLLLFADEFNSTALLAPSWTYSMLCFNRSRQSQSLPTFSATHRCDFRSRVRVNQKPDQTTSTSHTSSQIPS
jgi:hypothetical protein